jgi:uncharacterized membrane protein YphA (DoxX/SURF4 family)
MNRWSKGFLVALRIAVGWHFLYEGLWKIQSDTGATAYATSWRPLQSSIARLRDGFEQGRTVDVDGWYDEVVRTFKARNEALAEDQKARLAELRDKITVRAAAGESGVIDFDWIYVRDTVLQIPPPAEAERFTALPFLQQSAGPLRSGFRGLVRDIDGLDRLTVESVDAALDRRSAQIARHYGFNAEQQSRLARWRDTLKSDFAATWNDSAVQSRLADYRLMRARVGDLAETGAPFHRERLAEDRKKLDQTAGDLLALANEPTDELAVQAHAIATVAQMGAGPVPRIGAPADWVDGAMKWGLTAMGACLLLGLFTPWAAGAATLQLAMFYLASPPWPGLPAVTLGGHYLYVDRNLIELIAVCTIATTGSGRWAGMDAYFTRRRAIAPETEEVRSFA